MEKIVNFKELYDSNKTYVRASLYWMVGPEPLDDLVQETFIKIWKSLGDFQNEAQVKTWIYRIAMNTAKDYLRKKSRYHSFLNESGFFKLEPSPDLGLAEGIEKSILKLGVKQREAFVLFYQMELTTEEVAESLNIAIGTVKSRLHKGREQFIKHLRKLGYEYGK